MSPKVSDVSVPGSSDPALIVTPTRENTGPAVLYLHWFDEAPNANRSQFLEEAKAMADHGITSLLPQLSFPWKSAPSDAESDRKRIDYELSVLAEAINHLQSLETVDPSQIAIVGHDFGAMYGVLLMSSVPTVGAVFVAPTARWADWFLAFWPIAGDRFDYMRILDQVDPINRIADVEAPLLLQFGTSDFYIAAMTAHGLKRSAPEGSQLKFYEGGHDMTNAEAYSDRKTFLLDLFGIQSGTGFDQ